ncbi:MAG: PRC-barrel domain-containing protein [Sphingomonas sp.]|nr:PRC-barrel domain-containing protein [Sphingomonas sp.]
MEQSISWIATAATIAAASITASNLGSRITGYGFVVFLVGSICWFGLGLLTDQPPLMWTNAVLTVLNIFGIWRWLGRQARIEEGAKAGAKDSRDAPGETLFPLSLLTKASLQAADGSEIGRSVDGMAGCGSGRIEYLVVSEGGVAGAGETLRRVPWAECKIEGDRLTTRIEPSRFGSLEQIAPDHWPAR